MRAIKFELLKLHESRRERPIYTLGILDASWPLSRLFLYLFAQPGAGSVTSDETELFKGRPFPHART